MAAVSPPAEAATAASSGVDATAVMSAVASAFVSGLLLSEVMSNASVLVVPDDDVVDSSTGNLLSDSSTDIFSTWSAFDPESTTRSFAVAPVSSLTSWGERGEASGREFFMQTSAAPNRVGKNE